MIIKIFRIFKFGWLNFWRQNTLSMVCIFILILTISLITALYLFHHISVFLISTVRDKVDISVYFKPDISEEKILEVKEKLALLPDVKSVEYISKEEALQNFIESNKENPRIMESLEIVGTNPLLAALNIKAQEASQYEAISDFLEKFFKEIIDHTNYPLKKRVIEKLFSITSSVNKIGVIFSIILGTLAILVAFNTIKIAIHSAGEEIAIMRLVGASNWFIQGPFIVQGMIYGVLSAIISFVLFGIICYFGAPKLLSLLSGFNIFNYFQANFLKIFLLQVSIGVGVGIFSSLIALRKYLKI